MRRSMRTSFKMYPLCGGADGRGSQSLLTLTATVYCYFSSHGNRKQCSEQRNGLDNDPFKFVFSNNALKSRSDSATQTTSSQQVCSTNRKEEICSRKQSHHKHCWSSHCSLGSLPQASMHLRCVLRMRGAGRVLGWGEDSQEVRGRKEEVTGLVGARGKIRTW